MPKIKIFTAKNVQQYGFTAREIDALNAEWELKASELGLEEHLPEYWRQAKRHMSEKLAGRVAAGSPAEGENKQLDGAPVELPSLDVDLADFDIAGEDEITAVDLPDEELEVEFLADELSGLESISGDDLELEIIPEWQTVSLGEMAEESAAVEELAFEEDAAQELTLAAEKMAEEDKPAEEFAAVVEPEIEVEEAAPELTLAAEERAEAEETAWEPAAVEALEAEKEEAAPEPPVAVEEWIEEMAAGEKIVPVAEPEFEPADTAALPETAVAEPVRAAIAEEEPALFAGQKKESFFGKIIARLKRMF